MTSSSSKVEYQSLPRTASATTTVNESVSSGLHPVPTSTDLIQSVIADMDLDPDSLSQLEEAFISAGRQKKD